MRRADLEEVRAIQIEILDVVTDFCEENGISYWLDGGTLLGAIRHKGYIPWDDDIDLGMLRPDYDRFLSVFNLSNERYKAYSIENNPEFLYPHAKVLDTSTVLYEPDINGQKLCINVDVFVYDNAPNDVALLNKQYKNREMLHALHLARTLKHKPRGSVLRRLSVYALRFCSGIFPRNYFTLKMIENSKKYIDAETRYVGNFTSEPNARCRKEIFSSFVDIDFEGKLYKAPVGYDEWLRTFYGDYMQLPPPEKRVSHHNYEAYITDY